MSFDSQSLFLAEHFLDKERPERITDAEYEQHTTRLAQEIQDVVEGFCQYDALWAKAKNAANSGQNDA